jgi:ubiquinone/menaquinone biosynthesis C-methylase UbiE
VRLGLIPESLTDALALATRRVPAPLTDTMVTTWLARTIMVATKVGVFDVLADGPSDAADVAAACGTSTVATEKLMNALVGARYLRWRDSRYELAPLARRWLTGGDSTSLRDAVLAHFWYWELIEHYETYVRTGETLDLHAANLPPQTWALYQRGMRANASLSAGEVARKIPVARDAERMLDLGGAHGAYALALCRRHPGLRATVLDLPDAIAESEHLLGADCGADLVAFRAGDARTDDLGDATWDVILAANLMHHFDEPTNRALSARVARALRSGGTFAILEIIRTDTPDTAGAIGALADLYFSALSDAGTWSLPELKDWQRAAGLTPTRTAWLTTIPGHALQIARKV